MIVDISILALLILANGLFAMSEMAIVSVRRARLLELAERGDKKAQATLELANSPNRFLATVQVGITLIGILAGAFGGATIAQSLAVYLKRISAIALYADQLAFGLVVIIITYLSLVIGELVPKRLALNSSEKIALWVTPPMKTLSAIVYPLVHLLSISTEAILKLLGVEQDSSEPLITEEEIKVLVRQGTEAGMFEEAEQDMLERVFRLGDQPATALMTPRLDVVWLDLNDAAEVNRRKIVDSRHNRFPVCHDSLDNVLGVVNVTDILASSMTGEPIDFTTILRQPLFIPESTHALKVLELFKKSGTHIAFVVDEYGVTQGLLTLNDVVEVIIEDVPFADEPQEPDMIQREDGSWLFDGMLSIGRFKQVFDLEDLPGESRGNYQTLGGFVVTQLGHIPTSSEHFEWENLRFEVMDMDGNRVDKVLVTPQPPLLSDLIDPS